MRSLAPYACRLGWSTSTVPSSSLAEPDRMDHQAPDVRHRRRDARIGPRVLDLDAPGSRDRLGAERRGACRRLAAVGPPERAAIGQRRRRRPTTR